MSFPSNHSNRKNPFNRNFFELDRNLTGIDIYENPLQERVAPFTVEKIKFELKNNESIKNEVFSMLNFLIKEVIKNSQLEYLSKSPNLLIEQIANDPTFRDCLEKEKILRISSSTIISILLKTYEFASNPKGFSKQSQEITLFLIFRLFGACDQNNARFDGDHSKEKDYDFLKKVHSLSSEANFLLFRELDIASNDSQVTKLIGSEFCTALAKRWLVLINKINIKEKIFDLLEEPTLLQGNLSLDLNPQEICGIDISRMRLQNDGCVYQKFSYSGLLFQLTPCQAIKVKTKLQEILDKLTNSEATKFIDISAYVNGDLRVRSESIHYSTLFNEKLGQRISPEEKLHLLNALGVFPNTEEISLESTQARVALSSPSESQKANTKKSFFDPKQLGVAEKQRVKESYIRIYSEFYSNKADREKMYSFYERSWVNGISYQSVNRPGATSDTRFRGIWLLDVSDKEIADFVFEKLKVYLSKEDLASNSTAVKLALHLFFADSNIFCPRDNFDFLQIPQFAKEPMASCIAGYLNLVTTLSAKAVSLSKISAASSWPAIKSIKESEMEGSFKKKNFFDKRQVAVETHPCIFVQLDKHLGKAGALFWTIGLINDSSPTFLVSRGKGAENKADILHGKVLQAITKKEWAIDALRHHQDTLLFDLDPSMHFALWKAIALEWKQGNKIIPLRVSPNFSSQATRKSSKPVQGDLTDLDCLPSIPTRRNQKTHLVQKTNRANYLVLNKKEKNVEKKRTSKSRARVSGPSGLFFDESGHLTELVVEGNSIFDSCKNMINKMQRTVYKKLAKAKLNLSESSQSFPEVPQINLIKAQSSPYTSLFVHARPDQISSIENFFDRKVSGYSYVFADSPGMGKTMKSLEIIFRTLLEDSGKPCIVLAPRLVCSQWPKEFEKFFTLSLLQIAHNLTTSEVVPNNIKENVKTVIYDFVSDNNDLILEALGFGAKSAKEMQKILEKLKDDVYSGKGWLFRNPGLKERLKEIDPSTNGWMDTLKDWCQAVLNTKALLNYFLITNTVCLQKKSIFSFQNDLNRFAAFSKFLSKFKSPSKAFIISDAKKKTRLKNILLSNQIPEKVIVTQYSQLESLSKQDFQTFSRLDPAIVVADEAHQMLSLSSNAAESNTANFKKIFNQWKCPKLALSATPIVNRYTDLLDLLQIISPSELIESEVFNRFTTCLNKIVSGLRVSKRELVKSGRTSLFKHLPEQDVVDALFQTLWIKEKLINQLVERNTRKSLFKQENVAPEKRLHKKFVKIRAFPTREQMEKYDEIVHLNRSSFFSRLHQVSSLLVHPDLVKPSNLSQQTKTRSNLSENLPTKENSPSPLTKYQTIEERRNTKLMEKINHLSMDEFQTFIKRSSYLNALFNSETFGEGVASLKSTIANEKKALIFVKHRIEADLVAAIAKKHFNLENDRVFVVHGSTKGGDDSVRQFKQLNGRGILVLLPKSGGFGLNFPRVPLNVVPDFLWTDSDKEQIWGRTLRGAGKKTIALIDSGLIESKLPNKIAKKKKQQTKVFLGQDPINKDTLKSWVFKILKLAEETMRANLSDVILPQCTMKMIIDAVLKKFDLEMRDLQSASYQRETKSQIAQAKWAAVYLCHMYFPDQVEGLVKHLGIPTMMSAGIGLESVKSRVTKDAQLRSAIASITQVIQANNPKVKWNQLFDEFCTQLGSRMDKNKDELWKAYEQKKAEAVLRYQKQSGAPIQQLFKESTSEQISLTSTPKSRKENVSSQYLQRAAPVSQRISTQAPKRKREERDPHNPLKRARTHATEHKKKTLANNQLIAHYFSKTRNQNFSFCMLPFRRSESGTSAANALSAGYSLKVDRKESTMTALNQAKEMIEKNGSPDKIFQFLRTSVSCHLAPTSDQCVKQLIQRNISVEEYQWSNGWGSPLQFKEFLAHSGRATSAPLRLLRHKETAYLLIEVNKI